MEMAKAEIELFALCFTSLLIGVLSGTGTIVPIPFPTAGGILEQLNRARGSVVNTAANMQELVSV